MELNELSLVTQCGVIERGFGKKREKAKPHIASHSQSQMSASVQPLSSPAAGLQSSYPLILLVKHTCDAEVKKKKERNIHFNLRSWSFPWGAAIKIKRETQHWCCCKASMCSLLIFSTLHSNFLTSFWHKASCQCFKTFISMVPSFVTWQFWLRVSLCKVVQ